MSGIESHVRSQGSIAVLELCHGVNAGLAAHTACHCRTSLLRSRSMPLTEGVSLLLEAHDMPSRS